MKRLKIPYKWELVIILWFALFFHQADRQIFNVLLSAIRDDLGLTDSDMGLVSSVLLFTFGLLVPVAGVVGDRVSKKNVIAISLLVWTTATLATGMSTTLVALIALRSVATGGGEAFYSPSANSLISEHHRSTLSTALSLHQTALYVGVISSSYITGLVADLYGWRMAFYVFGGAGIFLASIIYFRVRTGSVAPKEQRESAPRKSVKEVVRLFFKRPTAVLLALAFTGMQFAGVGFMTWMPTLLHEKFNLSLAQAGFHSTFYYKICAFLGILIGARFADTFAKKMSGARGFVQMIGLFLGVPALFFMGATNSLPLVYVALATFGLCQGLYDSNIFATLYEVIEQPYRSTATGIMLSFAFIIGSLSPYLLGLLKPVVGLSWGISFLATGYLFAGLCILLALLRFFNKDKLSSA